MSKKKTYKEFIKEFKEKFPDRDYEFDESTFYSSHSNMRFICHKKDKDGNEHGEFWRTPKSLLHYGCVKCSYEERAKNYTLTTNEFIEKARKIHGDKYDYSKSIYIGTKEDVIIICPIHGEFHQKPNDHLSGKGCSDCNTPHLEEELKLYFEENNIKYIHQYHIKWLGKQTIDFYLPDYNIGIECQGKQHFGKGGWSNNFDFNKQYELDTKKYNLCKKNNISLLYYTKENIKENFSIYNKDNTFYKIENLINYVNKRRSNK